MGNQPRTDSVRSFQSSVGDMVRSLTTQIFKYSTIEEIAKLGGICAFPILVVVGLCVQSLLKAESDVSSSDKISNSVILSRPLADLAGRLARERGLRCEYLLIERENSTSPIATFVRDTLLDAEKTTDQLLPKTKNILPPSFANFTDELTTMRRATEFDKENLTCSYILDWYTYYSHQLIEKAGHPFVASGSDGTFWAAVYAYGALLTAKDLIGLERALGSSFFVQGGFPTQTYNNFTSHNGTADALLNRVTFVLYPPSGDTYAKQLATKPRDMSVVYDSLRIIFENNRSFLKPDADSANNYFNNITTYINLVTVVEAQLTDFMRNYALSKLSSCSFEYSLTLGLVIAALVISPGFATWYAWQSRKMLARILQYTEQLKEQKSQVAIERKRADLLLFQMIPKQIANRIKKNEIVAPESFDEATLYFSDVYGFADTVAHCEPFQIVNLLNQLYTKMDSILDQYDAFKVETITDSYIVVSGVPVRNGRQHSAVICQMALNILMELKNLDYICGVEEGTLKLRIGIHTGTIVAGIIGVRNQRYCLFGDTINMTSRMMSHGIALQIQLSPTTKEHLDSHHPKEFEVKERGPLQIKGKGTLVTYWLLGKRYFPFRIEITS